MSVNHYLLPVSDIELAAVLAVPEQIRTIVESRDADICRLGTDGVAIVALTAKSEKDLLAFIRVGTTSDEGGWVGKYAEENGVAVCEVDMGFGPASYYRSSFLKKVAGLLEQITVEDFSANCDVEWLDKSKVYPSGWLENGRKEGLIETYERYRSCILDNAQLNMNLWVWCA